MELPMFIYRCTQCDLLFGVDQREEDQSIVNCPACKSDIFLENVGHGTIEVTEEGDKQ